MSSADPNLTTFQGRMCTRVKRDVLSTISTTSSTSTSTSSTSTSTSTSSTSTPTTSSTSTSTSTSTTSTSTSTSTTSTSTSTSTTSTSTSTSTTSSQTPTQNQPAQTQAPNAQQPSSTTTSSTSTTATTNANPPNRQPQPQVNTQPTTSATSTTSTTSTTPTTSTTSTTSTTPTAPTTDTTPTAQQQSATTSTDTSTSTTLAAAQPAQSQDTTTTSQNTQPAQKSNVSSKTSNTVAVGPAAGGQAGPLNPAKAPVPATTLAATTVDSTGTKTSTQAGADQTGSTVLAEPDTSPLANAPLPALASGQTPTIILPTGKPATLQPSTSTTVLISTGTNGVATSITSAIVITPTPAHGGDGSSNGAGHSADDHHSSGSMAAGAVVGTVLGVVGALAIVGFLFFCFKRRRSGGRNSGSPLLSNRDGASSMYSSASARFAAAFTRRPSGERFSNARSAMSEKVGAVFAKRPTGQTFTRTREAMSEKLGAVFTRSKGSLGEKEASMPRMPTPNLERGMRDNTSSVYSKTIRTRSSSVPVMALRDRAFGFFKAGKGPGRPRLHRKKDSDTSFVGVAPSEAPPRLPSPIAQHRRSAASVSSFLQSWSATDEDNDPFRDPDDNQPLKVTNPGLTRTNTMMTTTTVLPDILRPTSRSPLPEVPVGALAQSPGIVTPALAPPQKPRHKRSFSQTRIQNPFLDPEPAAVPASPTSMYTTADGVLRPGSKDYRRHSRTHTVASYSRPLQREPSKASVDSGFASAASPLEEQKEFDNYVEPRKPWQLSTVMSSRKGGSSVRSSNSSRNSPFGDDARLSQFSFLNDRGSLSSSPGPTRPVTAAYPSYILDRQSRVSDPFDLDRPEVLAMMKQHYMQETLNRAGSISSSKPGSSPMPPFAATPRKSSNALGFLPNQAYRPV